MHAFTLKGLEHGHTDDFFMQLEILLKIKRKKNGYIHTHSNTFHTVE